MSSKELTEWIAFASVEPIGEAREDLRTANLMALIANVNRDQEKKPEPFSPSDFVVDYWHEPDVEINSMDRNIAIAESFAAIGLGTIERPEVM